MIFSMKRQNRTVGLLLFSALLFALVVWFIGELRKIPGAAGPTEALSALAPDSGPESMGDPADESQETKDVLSQILADARKCLGLPGQTAPAELTASADSLTAEMQKDFGSVQKQGDRWMSWNLRTHEGRERRLRLEVNDVDGTLRRELRYYAIDREGLPIPLELEPRKAMNPTDETVNQMLKEGDVFYKERAGYDVFNGGVKVEFVEAEGFLSEFEVERNGTVFRCPNLKNRSVCACAKPN